MRKYSTSENKEIEIKDESIQAKESDHLLDKTQSQVLSYMSTVQNEQDPLDGGLRKRKFVKKNYAYLSIFAGLLFGGQLFSYEYIVGNHRAVGTASYTLYYPMFIGYYALSFVFYLQEFIRMKVKFGYFWNIRHSCYFYREHVDTAALPDSQSAHQEGQQEPKTRIMLNKYNVVVIFFKSLFGMCGIYLKIGVLYTSTLADMNYSLISNIYCLTPFLVSLMFWLIFQETLHKLHVIGIFVIISGVVLTSVGSEKSTTEGKVTLSPLIPLMLALVYCISQAANAVITRLISKFTNISVQQMTADSYLVVASTMLILFCTSSYAYSWQEIISIAGVSCLAALATYILSEAIAYGKAGPSSALHEIQNIFLLLLEILLLNSVPDIYQIIGFCIVFAGGTLIAYETKQEERDISQ